MDIKQMGAIADKLTQQAQAETDALLETYDSNERPAFIEGGIWTVFQLGRLKGFAELGAAAKAAQA